MRKIPRVLSVVSLVFAGYLSMSLWDRLTAEPARTNARETAADEPGAPVTTDRSQTAPRVIGQAATRQGALDNPQASAAPKDVIDPEQQRRTALRTMLAHNNPDLAEALGLTEQQAKAVLEVVAEGTLNGFAANAEKGLSDAERRQARLAAQSEQESALKALIGEQKFRDWEVYQQGSVRRQQVVQLRTRLQAGPNPLSDEQSRALIAAVTADNGLLHGATGGKEMPDISAFDQSERRLLDEARTILNPAQFDDYAGKLRAEMAMRRQQLEWQAAAAQ